MIGGEKQGIIVVVGVIGLKNSRRSVIGEVVWEEDRNMLHGEGTDAEMVDEMPGMPMAKKLPPTSSMLFPTLSLAMTTLDTFMKTARKSLTLFSVALARIYFRQSDTFKSPSQVTFFAKRFFFFFFLFLSSSL